MNNQRQTWTCKIGVVGTVATPPGADAPMRDAAFAAFKKVTGQEATECFSGWGDTWTEGELAVIENREPDFPDDPKDARIAKLETERDELRATIANGSVQLTALQDCIAELEAVLDRRDDGLVNYAHAFAEFVAERDRLRETLDSCEHDYATIRAQRDRLRECLSEALSFIDASFDLATTGFLRCGDAVVNIDKARAALQEMTFLKRQGN